MKEEKTIYDVPKWLKELQENSWELELLISGGAIFTLFQLSDILIEITQTWAVTNPLPGKNMIFIMGMIGIKMLTLGFIAHLIVRAYWVALVCINFVFPKGIDKGKINWRKPYKIDQLADVDMHHRILQTDRNASTIIFIALISTFLIAGLVFLIFFCLTLPVILSKGLFHFEIHWTFWWDYYFLAFELFGLAYIIDLFSNGWLRRIPFSSYVTYPVFWLFDKVSLRYIYQPSLWILVTNAPKRKRLLNMGLFTIVSLVFAYTSTYKKMHWPNVFDARKYSWELAETQSYYGNYRDELGDDKIGVCAIPSKIIRSNYLEVFVVYRKEFDDYHDQNIANNNAEYLSDIYQIKIDDSLYTKLEWVSQWNRDVDQLGTFAMIPIDHLSNGKHLLELEAKFELEDELKAEEMRRRSRLVIPFWKDVF